MLTRKPRKGDKLVSRKGWVESGEWEPLGTVHHCDPYWRSCVYDRADGSGSSSFIWWFDRDQIFNRLVAICCRGCGEPLTGHEDESGTHCRWCVTCGEPVESAVEESA